MSNANNSEGLRVKTQRTPSLKAMRLLGLTELPPEALPIEHTTILGRPSSFQSGYSASRSKSPSSPSATAPPIGAARLIFPPVQRLSLTSGGAGSAVGAEMQSFIGPSPNASSVALTELYEGEMSAGCGGIGGNSGYTALDVSNLGEDRCMSPYQHSTSWRSERLAVTEASSTSVKLTDSDLDDDSFLRLVTDLMRKFPEPPSTAPNTPRVASSGGRAELGMMMASSGRNRKSGGDTRRSLNPTKSFSAWRGGEKPQRRYQRQNPQQQQQKLEGTGKQEEVESEEIDPRRTFELADPIKHAQTEGDVFEL